MSHVSAMSMSLPAVSAAANMGAVRLVVLLGIISSLLLIGGLRASG